MIPNEIVPNKKHRETIELLIKQEGNCSEPVNVSCFDCPWECETQNNCAVAVVFRNSKSYLAELDKTKLEGITNDTRTK